MCGGCLQKLVSAEVSEPLGSQCKGQDKPSPWPCSEVGKGDQDHKPITRFLHSPSPAGSSW